MRVLMVHNEYLMPGGEDNSTRAETALLQQNGIAVETYWVKNTRLAQIGRLAAALRSVWSTEVYNDVDARLRKQHFDVVHVQNFFPLISPSVYYAAHARGVPVVQSLRNYRLICPNGAFFRSGYTCEECLGRAVPWPGVVHGCYRNSHLASGVVSTMLVSHRALGTWSRKIDVFIALTEFAKEKFTAGGLPAAKIAVKPNFVFSPALTVFPSDRKYLSYVGRLSEEKGAGVLVDALHQLGTSLPLRIAGTGPIEERLRATAARHQVDLLGQIRSELVIQLLEGSRCLIFPSVVYEGMPRVILEAFAAGTPVIAPRFGAMSTLVSHGVTGLHFEVGNAADLAAKVEWAWEHPEEMAQMGRNARAEFEAKYAPEKNYKMLMEIYQRALTFRGKATNANSSCDAVRQREDPEAPFRQDTQVPALRSRQEPARKQL